MILSFLSLISRKYNLSDDVNNPVIRIRFTFGALLPENAVVPPKMAKFGLLF